MSAKVLFADMPTYTGGAELTYPPKMILRQISLRCSSHLSTQVEGTSTYNVKCPIGTNRL